MKKLLLSILSLLLPMLASAYDIAVENDDVTIYYNYINNGTELEVTYIGPNFYSSATYSGEVKIPDEVTYRSRTRKVTSIGENAFYRCRDLTSVTIPNSVTKIGDGAFMNCSGLISVTIGNSVTSIGNNAFDGCTNLTSVHITDLAAWCKIAFSYSESNPLYYGQHLFLNDEEIKDLVIPNSVTSIGNYAFERCTGLTSVTIPNSVTSIGYYAFQGCSGLTSVTIPNSVTTIEGYAFCDCTSLTSVHITDLAAWCKITFNSLDSNPLTFAHHLFLNGEEIMDLVIPNSVTSIRSAAFAGCTGLTSVTIPNSVTSIEGSAFYECSGLTTITIPNSVTSIGEGAIANCTGLSSVTIPNSVTAIRYGTFSGCSGLTSVTIPNSVTSIGGLAFYNCSGLTSVTIPNSVTTIEKSAFKFCRSLTSLTIPNSVTSIGEGAFDSCSGLTSVTIPNSVTTIEGGTFYGCSGLNTIFIPNSVTAIGVYAFSGCTSLISVISKMQNPCSIDESCFDENVFNNATLYIPEGTIGEYESTECWNLFVHKVEGEPVVTQAKAVAESIPVLISSQNGNLVVKSEQEGQSVAVYSLDGKALGSAQVKGGQAVIATNLPKGAIVVVKVGERSVKALL